MRLLPSFPSSPFRLRRLFAFASFASALAASLPAQTTVRFDSLTPTVTGPGSIASRGTTQSVVTVGTVSSFGLNALAGGDPAVMSIPALSSTQGFTFNTGVTTGNGGGAYINQYTMAFDLYWTGSASSGYGSLLNTDGNNTTDGDFFRRSSGSVGIGTASPAYFGNAQLNQWNRVVFTVTNTSATQTTIGIYLNGTFLGNSVQNGGTDGRFSLFTGASSRQTLLFTDNNNETGALFASQFFFDNRVYSSAEIAALGGASFTPSAIPEPGTYAWLAGATGLTFAAWRRRHHRARSSAG